ncbi:hypothetical protein O0L34_g10282 [Tuta absoluta]|nr:hypothetical protein O0L34_g10282 [Tuta absoluta]
MDFSGKVVIVTGSSSGIGAATARLFAAHGALVTIVGRNEKRLMEVGKTCTSQGHVPTMVTQDLIMDGGCEKVVSRTLETHGKIDILVNSAGKIALTSVFDNNMEVFDDLIALNLRVPYKMTQLCTPHLKKTKGCIVNVFAAPMKATPGFLVQTMLRDALERFTKTGAVELASEGIRMNAVRPGITRTNLLANLSVSEECMNKAYSKIAKYLPNEAIIEPEEVGMMILFAASGICPNLNASSLIIDGAASVH